MDAPLEPLSDMLNRPDSKFGIPYRYILLPPGAAVPAFFFISHIGAFVGLILTYLISWYVTKKDPARFTIFLNGLSPKRKAHYDPFV